MSYLLDAAPPVAANFVRPYDVAQLDAHPDAARVWATIVAVREECSSEGTEALNVQLTAATNEGYQDGVNNTVSTLGRLKLKPAEEDGFLTVWHNMDGEIGAALTEALDDFTGALNDQLGAVADDLANLADAHAKGAAAIEELRTMLEGAEPLAGIDWRTKHDLQQGRIRADSLAKALKKDDLAYVAMLAISALHRLAKV